MGDTEGAGFLTLSDVEAAGAAHLSPEVWAYVQGGAGEERSVGANRDAFRRRTLRPRALVDVGTIDPTTTLLGERVRVPFFVAPMAYHGLIHPEAEDATARAAAAAGVLNVVSTLSTRSLEDIARAAPSCPRWFQLYLQPDFAVSRRLVERAAASGYRAIVLTVDVPVLATRDRQARGGVAIDEPAPIGNGTDVEAPLREPTADGDRFTLRAEASETWDVVDRVAAASRLPVVVKGVLSADDARRAIDHGARAVVVSNHGGRQLDGAPAALDVLAEVVAGIGSDAEVYVDGGVRRGSDIVLALALGARAVGLGRPVLWALAAGGEAGVARLLFLLRQELVSTMAIAGRRTLAEIDATALGPNRW